MGNKLNFAVGKTFENNFVEVWVFGPVGIDSEIGVLNNYLIVHSVEVIAFESDHYESWFVDNTKVDNLGFAAGVVEIVN